MNRLAHKQKDQHRTKTKYGGYIDTNKALTTVRRITQKSKASDKIDKTPLNINASLKTSKS